MSIKLNKPFAANSTVDEYDVRQIKKTLNRLGYYQPYEKTGITGIPDREIFGALKKFQKDRALPATGEIRPGDETIEAINKEFKKTPKGYYIWRSIEDDQARNRHAKYNNTVRSWTNFPHPCKDLNSSCWAAPVSDDQILKEELQPPKIETPKIPGTNIPDRGIPEQGWPGSKKYDPFKPEIRKDVDPHFVMPTPPRGRYMEKFPRENSPKKKEWDL